MLKDHEVTRFPPVSTQDLTRLRQEFGEDLQRYFGWAAFVIPPILRALDAYPCPQPGMLAMWDGWLMAKKLKR